ncbi:MAG: hypothetical protein ACREJT_14140 [Myxococcota bacterium]
MLTDAVSIDPTRRDREIALGRLSRGAIEPAWDSLEDPEVRRRVGYIVDLAQHVRGQTQHEADQLERLRRSLPMRPPQSFWPGERALPIGTDAIAERWGYSRGIDLLRLRAAMTGPVVEPLPAASHAGVLELGRA